MELRENSESPQKTRAGGPEPSPGPPPPPPIK